MIYKNSNLYIDSDFEIRILREEDQDIDILIPIENRTLNFHITDQPKYLSSRLQFPMIKNIIIRFCTIEDNNMCTIHLLRSIDLQLSVVNFEMDYNKNFIQLKDKEYFVELKFPREV